MLAGQRAVFARYTARTDEQISASQSRLRPDGLKRCRRCCQLVALSAFTSDRSRPDGLHGVCRVCDSSRLLRIAAPRWSDEDLHACVYCGAPFEHVDHVWASSEGGPDHPQNLVPACADCNLSKNARPVEDFIPADLLALVAEWPVRVVEFD
ncbi:HNH endonuclease signature motif containing protein [Micromonospora sp. WMMD1082]|uniref:HNH endonuclease n=1 Tax=Micromonospora sp. WMMD1082 TaxID=3016104 RepID=UPI002417B48D|nr:HNH endonuclease signature motif containing protein [Micromonospora sp. WMMD1082]MDG4792681.1 HNH endonuclease signature motif containing protein [Micromonospora sp. WMMD1082]